MIPIEDLPTADVEEPEELIELANEATAFLSAHGWFRGFKSAYFDRGFSKVAVFFFEVKTKNQGDQKTWVVVGDLPPAHLAYEYCPNGAAALDGYVAEMQAWVDAVNAGEDISELIPVCRRLSLRELEPTKEHAEMLGGRLEFIRSKILVDWQDEL